jgi:hypothetical protein
MLNFSEKNRFASGTIFASAILLFILDTIPVFWLADYYGRKAVGLAESSDRPGAPVIAFAFWAVHLNIQSRWGEALDSAQRALDIQHERRYWHTLGWTVSVMSLSDVHIHLGNFTKALEYALSLVQFGQDSADPNARYSGLSRLGFAQKGLGQLESAVDNLQEAMELADSASNFQLYVDCGGDLGQCYLRQGRYDKAFAIFDDCRRLSIEHNLMKSPVTTRYRNGLAEAYLLAAEDSDEDQRNRYLKNAQSACKEALKQGKAYVPGMPEAMMLRGRYEWLNGDHAAAKKWWQDSRVLADQKNLRFDLGRTLMEMGQRLGDIGLLEQAESIFVETNSEWELARVKEIVIDLNSINDS